jgi:hypothetical protein
MKLSLCLINYPLCHEDVWGSGRSSTILNVGNKCGRVVSITSRPLYPRGKSLRYPLRGGSVGPRAGLDAVGRRKIPLARLELNSVRPTLSPSIYYLSYPDSNLPITIV